MCLDNEQYAPSCEIIDSVALGQHDMREYYLFRLFFDEGITATQNIRLQ